MLGLPLSEPKCQNLIMSPGGYTGPIFCRNSELTTAAAEELRKRDKRLEKPLILMGERAATEGYCPEHINTELPRIYSKTVKIPGKQFDEKLGFVTQVHSTPEKVTRRHGGMAHLAKKDGSRKHESFGAHIWRW